MHLTPWIHHCLSSSFSSSVRRHMPNSRGWSEWWTLQTTPVSTELCWQEWAERKRAFPSLVSTSNASLLSRQDWDRQIPSSSCFASIPPAGVYLKDFVFLNDGHPTRLNNGLINFTKLRTICMKVSWCNALWSCDTCPALCESYESCCHVMHMWHDMMSCDVMHVISPQIEELSRYQNSRYSCPRDKHLYRLCLDLHSLSEAE